MIYKRVKTMKITKLRCVFERGRLKTKQKQTTTSGRDQHEARTEKDQGSV